MYGQHWPFNDWKISNAARKNLQTWSWTTRAWHLIEGFLGMSLGAASEILNTSSIDSIPNFRIPTDPAHRALPPQLFPPHLQGSLEPTKWKNKTYSSGANAHFCFPIQDLMMCPLIRKVYKPEQQQLLFFLNELLAFYEQASSSLLKALPLKTLHQKCPPWSCEVRMR